MSVYNLIEPIPGTAFDFKSNMRITVNRLKQIRDILIEFAVRYRQERIEEAINPSTVDGFMRSIAYLK